MKQVLIGERPFIGIAATSRCVLRTFPPEYVRLLVADLIPGTPGTIVLFGQTEEWNRSLKGIRGAQVVNLIDHTNVAELVALCSLLDLMIGADSGPIHIAGALGVNCLAFFGSTDPGKLVSYYRSVRAFSAQKEYPCSPCWGKKSCEMPEGSYGAPCMRAHTPEIIGGTVKNLLKRSRIVHG